MAAAATAALAFLVAIGCAATAAGSGGRCCEVLKQAGFAVHVSGPGALPLVLIDSHGAPIPDPRRVPATLCTCGSPGGKAGGPYCTLPVACMQRWCFRAASGADARVAGGAGAADASQGGAWGRCLQRRRVGQMPPIQGRQTGQMLQILPREAGGARASMEGGCLLGQGASVACACSVLGPFMFCLELAVSRHALHVRSPALPLQLSTATPVALSLWPAL